MELGCERDDGAVGGQKSRERTTCRPDVEFPSSHSKSGDGGGGKGRQEGRELWGGFVEVKHAQYNTLDGLFRSFEPFGP